MFKKLKFLRGGISSVADIEAALAEYDVATIEASLATAQQRRTDLLLTGSDAEILAAEDAATKSRLALDRAHAAVVELNRRLEEACAEEEAAAARKRRDDAAGEVDRVVARIRKEYAAHARAIAALVEEADIADKAARVANSEIYERDNPHGLDLVPFVAPQLGWHDKYFNAPDFVDGISLPAIGTFPGVGAAAKWVTREYMYALTGNGGAGWVGAVDLK
jgi:hypothetical protein